MKGWASRIKKRLKDGRHEGPNEIIRKAIEPYFDREYYLATYPDVAASGQDPLTHYFKWGDSEGRKPSAGFDPTLYRMRFAPTRENTLHDAILEGRLDRATGMIIETIDDNRGRTHSVAPSDVTPKDTGPVAKQVVEDKGGDQLTGGAFRLLPADDVKLVAANMNENWYFDRYPEAAQFGGSAAAYHLAIGWVLGHDPSPEFSTSYYLRQNPDIAKSGINPFLHYLKAGRNESWRRKATIAEAIAFEAFKGPLAAELAEAVALDPMVALPMSPRTVTSPFDVPQPVRDALTTLRQDFSGKTFSHVVLLPQVRMSGAARVAGIYAATLAEQVGAENVLIVRTDGSAFEHPGWFPKNVQSYDLSAVLGPVKDKHLHPQLLVDLLRGVEVQAIHLFNSRLGWDTLQIYGRQLSQEAAVTAYLFTWEETRDGRKVGYPIQWLRDTIDYCHVIVCDSTALADHVRDRFGLPATGPGAPIVALTPVNLPDPAIFESRMQKRQSRVPTGRVLWAGRLDRQKRPDLLEAVARSMPDTTFEVYGRAVLDEAPKTLESVKNIKMMGEYEDFASVVARDYDAFLYTAQWDGTPTILLDAVGQGLPIVASAVGGIGALLDDKSGWPIADIEDVGAYRTGLEEARSDGVDAARRAYDHTRALYAPGPYAEAVAEVRNRMAQVSQRVGAPDNSTIAMAGQHAAHAALDPASEIAQ